MKSTTRKRWLLLFLVGAAGCVSAPKVAPAPDGPDRVSVIADASQPAGRLDHAWEKMAGSGNARLYLRDGWSERLFSQLADAHENLGVEMVRFHGVFGDEVGLYQGPGKYDFTGVDRLYDGVLAAGVKPFIELSFMPRELASGRARGFPLGYRPYISPPKDYDEWGRMVEALVRHLVDRYGLPEVESWFFEVWNEPNLFAFWSGTRDDYFRLYEVTARAVKAVSPALMVGGPASSCHNDGWLRPFLEFGVRAHQPLDFISTHGYYNNDFSELVEAAREAHPEKEFEVTGRKFNDQMRAVRRIMDENEASNLPLFITEWGSNVVYSYRLFPGLNDHDLPNDAAFMCKAVKEVNGLTSGFSHWTYSDVFEEWGLPGQRWPVKTAAFHGGFGLITVDGIHKPSYHAFAFLHRMGTGLVRTEVAAPGKDLDALVTVDDGRLAVIVWYWLDTVVEKQKSGPEAILTLRLEDLPSELVGQNLTGFRIDREHGNPYPVWIAMGGPSFPDADQVRRLRQASDGTIRAPELDRRIEGPSLVMEFPLPPGAVVFLTAEAAPER